jgi:hypothetical protein
MLQANKPIRHPRTSRTSNRKAELLDPATIETRFYGLVLRGDCLDPIFKDGDKLVIDKQGPLHAGCFAVFYYRPELVPPGELTLQLKRLVTAMPLHLTLPYREHPKSEIKFVVGVEQLNPAKQWIVECEDLLAVHHCLGRVDDPKVQARLQEEWPIGKPQP